MYMVIAGTGTTYYVYGPFETEEKAREWARANVSGYAWSIGQYIKV